MSRSKLTETLDQLCNRSAAAVVARGRLRNAALNAALLRRLSAPSGDRDALLSPPIFESARIWRPAEVTLGELSGMLLDSKLVDALDRATKERMPHDRRPYAHQLEAWKAAAEGRSFLVTSGTGSGKTECFMIPMLDGLLRDPAQGFLQGVRAIVIYPLNALIESQRERLDAWTTRLSDRIHYALFNGLTPEKPRMVQRSLGLAELGDRKSIREMPPAILITNVTMLEYLLLRANDQPILERSQGLLRWIVLDEVHTYVGAQAAEMTLLLRRVRAAFGVSPEQVQVFATSATVSDGSTSETEGRLKRFIADLAGTGTERVQVIHGQETDPGLPPAHADSPLDIQGLETASRLDISDHLASHPRIQQLKQKMKSGGLHLSEISQILFDDPSLSHSAQGVLDAAAQANTPGTEELLLPWRAHLFHRALGGLWVCVDPACPHRDPELAAEGSGWGFGAVWSSQHDRCKCGAQAFELHTCPDCGALHLLAQRKSGARTLLFPLREAQADDYQIDQEPDPEEADSPTAVTDKVALRPANQSASDRHLNPLTGEVFDNGAPDGFRTVAFDLVEVENGLTCCKEGQESRLQPSRFGPPFFMGNALPEVVEQLCPVICDESGAPVPGLPMSGRRALSFSDSRQGVARLAAKLQQDAERTLTRSFLYHAVQQGPALSPEDHARIEKKLNLFMSDEQEYSGEISGLRSILAGNAAPITWEDLIHRLADQSELRQFCASVWGERSWGGDTLAQQPYKLAEMLLFRELFRRPRVQNNAETMGLLRLIFPDMEKHARMEVPSDLMRAGVGADGWAGLAQAAVDFEFREHFAILIQEDFLAHWINPRRPGRRSVFRRGAAFEESLERYPHYWPTAKPAQGRMSRIPRLLYRIIQGHPDDPIAQDRVQEILDRLWSLITSTAARDVGRGAWRLDFSKAAVARLDRGWLCPVTQRIFGYATGGLSPYGPEDERPLEPFDFPRLPRANSGGLDETQRQIVVRWRRDDAAVSQLRTRGIWTDLHDRIATYPPFFRAQEHSGQIERPVLQRYEEMFKRGEINLLNCSTTMEMGVDIPHVALVVNSNVPPSVSNYRQRVGRAGRRGEPWAFGLTFCRNLPWDQVVFGNPKRYLTAPVSAPAVRLESAPLVMRHVHAALLGAFMRLQHGMNIRASIGEFFGGSEEPDRAVAEQNLADSFLERLREQGFVEDNQTQLESLVRGSALDGSSPQGLCAETALNFERLMRSWRDEYEALVSRAADASEEDIRRAFENRARRMHGEFLLSELARRGFTPSYGFPVDVVCFDHLSGHRGGTEATQQGIAFGQYQGAASRTLDIAIREYAPGAEVVIDGLVHRSEGIRPAWSAMADASRLEDLQQFWRCEQCGAFGLVRSFQDAPRSCTVCGSPVAESLSMLRPAGFLGRTAPHTSYESLGSVPYEMPWIGARTPWLSLPNPAFGRMRVDRQGQVVSMSSGLHGHGYQVCLCCGRAQSETDNLNLPSTLRDHRPLAPILGEQLVRGACPGGMTQTNRIQRHVRLLHEMHTDVFELQLSPDATLQQALALSAGLREALAKKLGVEAREIGIAAGQGRNESKARAFSSYLFDRATGGGGLVSHLDEIGQFRDCLRDAVEILNCREQCLYGCPACVLGPDMYFDATSVDRPGALGLAQAMVDQLVLPPEIRAFGEETRIVGQSLLNWLERKRNAARLKELVVFLHGDVVEWDLAGWPVASLFARLRESEIPITLVIARELLSSGQLDLSQKLALHRLAGTVSMATSGDLPMAADLPLLAIAQVGDGRMGIAAADPQEATPGPMWGLGQNRPLVSGSFQMAISSQHLDIAQMIESAAGIAKIITLQDQANGPVGGFGKRFWKTLQDEEPAQVAMMTKIPVVEVSYQDRYLMSPLHVRLLLEVLENLPGRSPQTKIEVRTASSEIVGQGGYRIYHNFASDKQREDVMRILFPTAEIHLQPKRVMPHARRLEIKLEDGRAWTLLLDQGFGAWRADGSVGHDFRVAASRQAEAVRTGTWSVSMAEKQGMPIVLDIAPSAVELAIHGPERK